MAIPRNGLPQSGTIPGSTGCCRPRPADWRQRRGLREDIRGDALHSLGRFKEARLAYRRAVKHMGQTPPRKQIGIHGSKDGAKEQRPGKLRRAAREVPDIYPVHDRLMKGCVMADKLEEAAETLEKSHSESSHIPGCFYGRRACAPKLSQWDRTSKHSVPRPATLPRIS